MMSIFTREELIKVLTIKGLKFINKIFIIRNKSAERVLYNTRRFVIDEPWKTRRSIKIL